MPIESTSIGERTASTRLVVVKNCRTRLSRLSIRAAPWRRPSATWRPCPCLSALSRPACRCRLWAQHDIARCSRSRSCCRGRSDEQLDVTGLACFSFSQFSSDCACNPPTWDIVDSQIVDIGAWLVSRISPVSRRSGNACPWLCLLRTLGRVGCRRSRRSPAPWPPLVTIFSPWERCVRNIVFGVIAGRLL